ncbi:hypothetical protein Bpfe_008384, partial [Biomphalaria pfeifferi]
NEVTGVAAESRTWVLVVQQNSVVDISLFTYGRIKKSESVTFLKSSVAYHCEGSSMGVF